MWENRLIFRKISSKFDVKKKDISKLGQNEAKSLHGVVLCIKKKLSMQDF